MLVSVSVLLPNCIGMVLLAVMLLSSSWVMHGVELMDRRIFMLMCSCDFLQCAGEIFAYAIDGVTLPGFRLLVLGVNALLFIVNISFAYLWVVYADYKIFESMDRIKKRGRILALPAVFIVAGTLVNLFTPVFFEVTAANTYQRFLLYPIPYVITYFYLVYGAVFIYRHKSQARRYVFLPAALFMVPIFLGSIVQLFFYGVSTVWVGVSIALVAVYINVQNEISYIDSLSGVYTRVYLHQYLENVIRMTLPSKKIAGIMMDVDKFKAINDKLGHVMGDDVIRSVGKVLHNALPAGCVAARYGGDEFVVLQEVDSEEDVIATAKLLECAVETFNREKGKPYTLRLSIGWSVLDLGSDTVDDFLGRMDEAMYEVKHARYAQG